MQEQAVLADWLAEKTLIDEFDGDEYVADMELMKEDGGPLDFYQFWLSLPGGTSHEIGVEIANETDETGVDVIIDNP